MTPIPPILEQAQEQLSDMLRTWDIDQEIDEGKYIRKLPQPEFNKARSLLELLVMKSQPTHRLQIEIGDITLKAYKPRKGADSVVREERTALDPGSKVTTDRIRTLYNIELNYYENFIGNETTAISLGSLALNLQNEGKLHVIEAPSSSK